MTIHIPNDWLALFQLYIYMPFNDAQYRRHIVGQIARMNCLRLTVTHSEQTIYS